MGVYIKGMEMPKDGEMLCVNIYPDGKVCINLDLECKRIATAVLVPPHGRLIDADALCKTLRSFAENEYTPKVFANWIENHIDSILEAEEGE